MDKKNKPLVAGLNESDKKAEEDKELRGQLMDNPVFEHQLYGDGLDHKINASVSMKKK